MFVDRTREFLSLVEVAAAAAAGANRGPLRSSAAPPVAPPLAPSAAAAAAAVPATRSAFMRAIGEVSTDLHGASLKLSALTKLVKRRGMFGDSGAEIERMTGSVKDDMRNVGARLDGLQEYIARRRDEAVRGGAQPGRPLPATAALGSGGPRAAAAPAPGEVDVLASIQGLSHSDAVVGQLKGQLLGQAASLKQLLQTRAESVQAQAGRRAQFGSVRDLGRPLDFASTAPSAGDVGAAAAAGAGGGSLGQPSRAPPRPAFGSAAPAANAGAGGDHDVISVGGANAFAQLSQAQLLPEAALVDARAADVAAIEQHINDLSTMFTRLASVVAEQGGLVERIEDNLESAHTNVEAGRTQLARHWERLSTNRALALRLGVVAVASVILFAVFGA